MVNEAKKRPAPRILTVKKAWRLTPNMIRVTFGGPELSDLPAGREGGNCKLMLPEVDESREHFAQRLADGPAPVRRTYTVRHYRADAQELDIDFVAHGDNGPASVWAMRARAGNFLGFMGPSPPKLVDYDADFYLIAADPSATPMAAATLEAMPRDAIGIAIFEVTAAQDRQSIRAPKGIDIHWLIHPDPQQPYSQQEAFIRSLPWPEGKVQTCIAGESGLIKSLRTFLRDEIQLPKSAMYLSGYWKIGMVEDEHQKFKRSEDA